MTDTRRYLLLLPAPEAEWDALPPEEHEHGLRNHQRFHVALAERGHTIVAGGPLEPSAQATSMRNTGRGSVVVTDGPFLESVEQMAGFYLLDSADEADLREIVREFAEGGDHVELRRVVS